MEEMSRRPKSDVDQFINRYKEKLGKLTGAVKDNALCRSEITTLLGEKMYRIEEIYLEEKNLNNKKLN